MRYYFVEIVSFESNEVIKRMYGGSNKRRAEAIDRGVNINLNHEDYYTQIIEEQHNHMDIELERTLKE